MRKLLSIFLLLSSFSISSKASHIAGAELRYEYNGTNYTVILDIYSSCAKNAAGLPITTAVDITSSLLNDSIRIMMPLVYRDTVFMPCAGYSACHMPSSSNPGFIKATYMDTVSLPNVSSDWKLGFKSAARQVGISNAASGTNYVYVEAELNNTNGANSSPFIPNVLYTNVHGLSVNITVPLQTIDPDGDSIVYERVVPMSTKNVNVNYPPGAYSATNPFGTNAGVYTINAANQTMTLRSNNQGIYIMAFKVKEYRNGVLVGTHIRDFSVYFFPNNNPITYPKFSFNSLTTVYACPSAADSSIVWFTDPTITDSVSVKVKTPTISGWTFGNSTVSGSPVATAQAWWTAPSNLNPSKLPFFYITYRVSDNGCPSAMADYAILVKTRQCNADSVWPGDANADKVVNLLDPLAIALAFNENGPARAGATTNWVAQAATDWNGNILQTPVNKKHADCNGNGTVNLADLGAVVANYGKAHPKGGASNKTTGAPEIFFDLSGITLRAGEKVDVPIKMGKPSNPIQDVYGIATRIKVSGVPPTTQSTIGTTDSWLGNSTATLNFEKEIEPGVIDWVHARTDHKNTNGTGTIGTLSYTVPTSAKPGDSVYFSFEHTVVINKDGELITNYNTIETTSVIQFPVSVNNIPSSLLNATVVPNPSGNTAKLYLQLAEQQELAISIVDVTGKVVWSESAIVDKGNSNITLPATQLSGGVYFISVQAANGASQKLKWVKR